MIYFTVKADINALKVIQNIYNLDWIFVNCWDLTTFIRPGGYIGTTLQFDSQDKDCWEDEQGQLQTELSGGGEISAGVTVTASMTFPRCFCLLSASSRPRTRETVLSVLSCLPCPARPTLGLGISPWLQWRREAASTDIRPVETEQALLSPQVCTVSDLTSSPHPQYKINTAPHCKHEGNHGGD